MYYIPTYFWVLVSICSQNFTLLSYFLHAFYVFVQSVRLLLKGFAVD
jgi:hypothetical protein